MPKDSTGGMGGLSKKSRQAADAALKDRELELLLKTSIAIDALRPQVSDQAAFDQLIAAVNISRQRNENIGELRQRLSALGQGAIKVAREVLRFI